MQNYAKGMTRAKDKGKTVIAGPEKGYGLLLRAGKVLGTPDMLGIGLSGLFLLAFTGYQQRLPNCTS